MSSFAKATHIFSDGYYIRPFLWSKSDTLTNDIDSFEQLGPDIFLISPWKHPLWELLIRSSYALLSTHKVFLCRNKKYIYVDTPFYLEVSVCLCQVLPYRFLKMQVFITLFMLMWQENFAMKKKSKKISHISSSNG